MINVLLLGAGTQSLAIVRDIKSFCRVYIVGERNNYGDCSRYVKKSYLATDIPSSEIFLNQVLSLIKKHKIEVLIPMGDAYSDFLSRNKAQLSPFAKFKIPDYSIFQRGSNKRSLMQLCMDNNYPHPKTYIVNSVDEIDKEQLVFPLLIKPDITCGGRGMKLVNSYLELKENLPAIINAYGSCHLQQYVKQGGAQVEIQLYINEERELVNSSVIYKYRWYPEKGGSSCCAKSIRNDKIVGVLYHLLLDLGWVGFADFDTIENPDNGELLIMELNPRVPACVRCAIEGGIHWGEIIVNDSLGLPQEQYDYHENEFLRHLGFETLWFLKSSNRFKTKPNWFKLIGKHIHYQDISDWSDPMPFIKSSFNNLCKVFMHKEKEKIER